MKLLLRWLITAIALFVAALLLPGIHVDGSGWIVYAVVAIILGLVNAIVRPILTLLTCPLVILTLGLFTLVINALTLWLSAGIAERLGFGFNIDGFWPAFWGALIVTVITTILSASLKDDDEDKWLRGRRRTEV